jgi:hypothetical protein
LGCDQGVLGAGLAELSKSKTYGMPSDDNHSVRLHDPQRERHSAHTLKALSTAGDQPLSMEAFLCRALKNSDLMTKRKAF